MLFGRTPWKSQLAFQIFEEAKTLSGGNLFFPEEPKVSQDCKDLLKEMINFHVEKRIEWSDLFNHKMFKDYEEDYKLQEAKNRVEEIEDSKVRMLKEVVRSFFKKN